MTVFFDHEKLDVYQRSLEFVAWTEDLLAGVKSRYRNTRDQLIRSSDSIPLNIAEGNGKRPGEDRKRYFEIARASATECAASLDVLVARKALTPDLILDGKRLLQRIVQMLIRMAPPDRERAGARSSMSAIRRRAGNRRSGPRAVRQGRRRFRSCKKR